MRLRLVTLGDSTLDSGRYSGGPGSTAPELLARALDAELVHLARDGHTAKKVQDEQLPRLPPPRADRTTILVVSVGGNDLLYSLSVPVGHESRRFGASVSRILERARAALGSPPTFVANVYDPAGEDLTKLLAGWASDPARARAMHARFNEETAKAARAQGAVLVDTCAAFAEGHDPEGKDPWIVARIEPSATGAREIARVFEEAIRAQGSAPGSAGGRKR